MSEKKVKTVEVKLITDNHSHQGEPCKAGDIIEVSQNQADRLIEDKVVVAHD